MTQLLDSKSYTPQLKYPAACRGDSLLVAGFAVSLRPRPANLRAQTSVAALASFAPEIVSGPRTPFRLKWARASLKDALFSPDWTLMAQPNGSGATLLRVSDGSIARQLAEVFEPSRAFDIPPQTIASAWSGDATHFVSCGYFLPPGGWIPGKTPEKYTVWAALWNTRSGKRVWRLEKSVRVTDSAQPAARFENVGARDATLHLYTGFNSQIWRVRDGKMVAQREFSSKNAAQTSPDGRYLLKRSRNEMRIQLASKKGATPIVLPGYDIKGWSPDGELLALQSFRPGLYRARDGRLLWSINSAEYGPNPFLGFSRDGQWVMTREQNGTQIVHLLRDTKSGQILRRFAWKSDPYAKIPGFSPDNRSFALPWRGGFRFYQMPNGELKREIESFDYGAESVAFSPDGKILTSGDSGSGAAISWNWRAGKIGVRFDHENNGLAALSWSRDGQFLATGNNGSCGEDTVRIWRVSDRKIIAETSSGYNSWGITALQWSPDGALLAVAGNGGPAQILDAKGKRVAVLDGAVIKNSMAHFTSGDKKRTDPALVWSSDGRFLLVGGTSGVSIWNRDGTLSRRLTSVRDVRSIARCPSGQRLVLGTTQGEIVMLRAADEHILWRKTLGTVRGQNAAVGVAFLPSDRVVSWGDGALRVWNATEGVETQTLASSPAIGSVTTSRDGSLIAATVAGGISVWEASQ